LIGGRERERGSGREGEGERARERKRGGGRERENEREGGGGRGGQGGREGERHINDGADATLSLWHKKDFFFTTH